MCNPADALSMCLTHAAVGFGKAGAAARHRQKLEGHSTWTSQEKERERETERVVCFGKDQAETFIYVQRTPIKLSIQTRKKRKKETRQEVLESATVS